jgi:hypothetical protein
MLDPSTLPYAKTLYPAPVNSRVPGTNRIEPRPEKFHQDMLSLRRDEQLGAHSISVRYNKFNSPEQFCGGIAGSTEELDGYGYSFGANCTYSISPTTIFHMMFSRTYVDLNLWSKWDNLDYDSFVPHYWPWNCNLPPGINGRRRKSISTLPSVRSVTCIISLPCASTTTAVVLSL